MEFLSENGIIGFLFFLTFFLIIFNKILNLKKYLKNKKSNIVLGIGSLLLAVMFPLKPSGAFFTTFNASILFYMLGFFLFYIDKLKKMKAKFTILTIVKNDKKRNYQNY